MYLPRPQDWEENNHGGKGSCQSAMAKRPRCSCSFDDRHVELLQEMRRMLKGQNEKIESMYKENQELREKILSNKNLSVPLRLRFVNSCGNDKYSMRKIEADDENLLQVAIYDHNDQIITREPFSSMRVHIVAVHADFDEDHKGQWTEEDFYSKIVTGRPGKEHLLSGNLYFRLQDGEGYLSNVKFQDNSSFVPSKRFEVGATAADERISERVQEGITESFAVKDIRGFSTKKSGNPSPRDAVYKLSRIAMDGDRYKLLVQNGIGTVRDFLQFYSRNPEDLRKIMGKISDQDWDTIVNHAHKCNPRPGIYSELDVQVAHQQMSSTYYGIASGTSSENVSEELEGLQVVNQQVSSVGNEILPDSSMDNTTLEGPSSQQRRSLELDAIPEGSGVVPGNASANDTTRVHMSVLQDGFLEDESWGDFDLAETYMVDARSVYLGIVGDFHLSAKHEYEPWRTFSCQVAVSWSLRVPPPFPAPAPAPQTLPVRYPPVAGACHHRWRHRSPAVLHGHSVHQHHHPVRHPPSTNDSARRGAAGPGAHDVSPSGSRAAPGWGWGLGLRARDGGRWPCGRAETATPPEKGARPGGGAFAAVGVFLSPGKRPGEKVAAGEATKGRGAGMAWRSRRISRTVEWS
ncbi:uncharacterized protein C2845_PM02G21260 [Panicum miliaceum]|uniref:Uncharacterized protein n=1 Tax=Panicum miliaceum TaxID=4540 RepID=A0A3L6SA76_PANMI|nr:uncharacterized protein C2845_PM02G21260 [Panicum miliaceum]